MTVFFNQQRHHCAWEGEQCPQIRLEATLAGCSQGLEEDRVAIGRWRSSHVLQVWSCILVEGSVTG